MKHKKWIIRLLITPLVFFVFVLIVGFILHWVLFFRNTRPLIPAPQWYVEAGTHTGEPISVKVYQVKGCEIFFLAVGDENPGWLAMMFSDDKYERTLYDFPEDDVHVLRMTPLKFPYLHYLTHRHFGVDVLHGKSGDVWLAYTGDSVVFSNRAFFVSATEKNSGRPPVDLQRTRLSNY